MLTNFVKHKIVLAPNVSAVVNVVAPVVQLTEHAVSKVFVAKNAPVASAAEWLTAIVFAKKKINKYINKMIGEYMNSFINWLSKRDSKVYKEVKSFYEVDASQSGMGIQ